ncbi:MAG: metal-sensing transcriptional repressor [Tissierella sp.]|uniref:metal-sensing transcriptional repressor n=1 Tax=Tissierella sp. TaxID=41274 RepID=UPI003F9AEFBE
MAKENVNDTKKKALNKLKTVRGQIDGIVKMLEDERYCVDISTQILSVIGLLKKANIDILNSHIRSCVANAILESEDEGDEKIEEIINIIDKYIK